MAVGQEVLTLVGQHDMIFRIAYSPDRTHPAVTDKDEGASALCPRRGQRPTGQTPLGL